MTLLFQNIAFFYLAVYIGVFSYCMFLGSRDSLLSALFLSVLAYAGWDDSLWHNPSEMAAYHMFVVVAMVFIFQGKVGLKMAFITMTMAIADIVYVINNDPAMMSSAFPYGLFWWQSILNLLFLSQCLIVLKGCYNSHKAHRTERRLQDNGKFYGKEIHNGAGL